MKILTIPMTEHRNIHSIANQHYNREIKFPKGCKYAVVLASYYGGKGYTCHKTERAAVAVSKRLMRWGGSHEIIDTDGNKYLVDPYGNLIREDA